MLRPSLLAVAASLCVAGALPAAAGATDFCVNTDCGGIKVLTLQQALDGASDQYPGADRIFLGEGPYTDTSFYGFHYQKPQPIEIIGQGKGKTILTGKAGSPGNVLSLSGAAGSSVHDLTIQIPENVDPGYVGLRSNVPVRRVEVIEHPTQSNHRIGAVLHGAGALEDSSVTLSDAQDTRGVILDFGSGIVRRSNVAARVGIKSNGGTIERSRVTASMAGVEAWQAATTISGSVIRFGGPGYPGSPTGIGAFVQPGDSTTVKADGVTLVGGDEDGATGVAVANGLEPEQSADLVLTNSIVRGAGRAMDAYAPAGATGHAKIAASYSDYDPSGNRVRGANASIAQAANVTIRGDAKFADAAGGDYRLLPGSPLIDAGDPAAEQGLDVAGNPLVADGDGDGTARRDLGAFELPAVPSGDEPDGEAPAGGGGTAGTTAGSTHAPPSAQAPVGAGGATSIADLQAPLISGFRATPSRFAVARARTPAAARLRRGTRFRYTLSEPARVTLRIQRKGRHRYRTVATLRRTAASGVNRTRFTGRVGKRALRPGRYRATLRATDAAGNRALRRTTRFRITRA